MYRNNGADMVEKSLEEKFDEFVRQYNLDMRGDNNTGEDAKLGLVDNVRKIGEIQRLYPSLTWLFAHKPGPTIAVTIGIFLVLYGLTVLGAVKMFGSMLGVDVSYFPDTH